MKKNWLTQIGVIHKPDSCKRCAYAAVGKGFCGDLVPENPIIAFVFDTITKDDVLEQEPLSGAQGYVWKQLLIEELGHSIDDVLVSAAVRCSPPNDIKGKPAYPSGFLGKAAELNCRQYDDGLIKFDPNVFLITLHPRTIPTVGAHRVQIQRDVSKAFGFARRGYRPCVLFGEGAAQLYFPYMNNNGGLKNWRGHWWVGESPFKDHERNERNISKRRFAQG